MWKRIKNLWWLSGQNFHAPQGEIELDKVKTLYNALTQKEPQMATIIDMSNPVERDFPDQQDI